MLRIQKVWKQQYLLFSMTLVKIINGNRYMTIKFFLSLLFASVALFTVFAGNSYCEEKKSHWELAVGPGLNIDGNHTSQILIAPALSIPSPKQWLQYRIEGDLELIDSDGLITAVIGAAPFLRFYMLEGEKKPFFELGAGANLISRNHTGDKDSGGAFIFSIMGGIGYEIPLHGRPFTVSTRFRHLSNCYIYGANQSLNTLYVLLSIGL
jgi:hypothetical protein